MGYLLPADVRGLIGQGMVVNTDNLALLFQRYLPERVTTEEGIHQFDSQYVHEHLKRVAEAWNGRLNNSRIQRDAKAFRDRHVSAIRSAATAEGSRSCVLTITAKSRLAVGLGSASAYENGLALHHILGLPYIPGSSIKGIVLNWLLERKNWDELGNRAGIDPEDWDRVVVPVFGTQEAQGLACFWDALPSRPPKLEVDIMNPHYDEYYQEPPNSRNPTKLPGDWYQPVPVFFMTVAPGAEFDAVITLRRRSDANGPGDGLMNELSEHLMHWVKSALEDWGVGAKTRKGYGQVSVSWRQDPTCR